MNELIGMDKGFLSKERLIKEKQKRRREVGLCGCRKCAEKSLGYRRGTV